MKRLRVAAAIVAVAVVWLGYWVAIEVANQRERRAAAAAPVAVQALVEPGATNGKVLYKARNKAGQPVQDPLGLSTRSTKSAHIGVPLAASGVAALGAPAKVPAVAAAAPNADAQPDSPAHVPFLQAAMSEAQAGVAPRRPGGSIGGATIPPMWGFSRGAGGAAGTPVATDEPISGDLRASVLGRKFPADGGESAGGTSSNDNGGSNGSNGSSGSAGSNDQNGGGQSASNTGSNGGTGSGGSSATGGSTQGGGGQQQGTGGATGGSNGTAAGGGSEGGAVNTLAADVAEESTPEVAVDVPEPGSILLGLGVAAAFLRRRMR